MTEPLPWLAKCVRPMLRARPGTIYRGADLSNIEGRVNAWQAGEQWKLDAFQADDLGVGPPIYETTAAGIIGCAIAAVTKAQRQSHGKVPELACGYQGSVGAFISMGANYNVKPEDVADAAAQVCDPVVWARTEKTFRPNMSSGLEPHIWTGVKVVVDGWRSRHPKIVQSWWDLQDAAVQAVSLPGSVVPCGKVRYLCTKGFLWCELPSGRHMAYPQPRVIRTKQTVLAVCDEPSAEALLLSDRVYVQSGDKWFVEEERWRNVVEVWGLEKGQWRPYTLYGGLQCENICQAIGRDVLDAGMKRIDRAGYPIVHHAHDSVLTECPFSFGTMQELADLLSQSEPWMAGLPLAAKASEYERYV